MVSEMAKGDILQMQQEGLNPTVDDIIRLNELALDFQRVKSCHSFRTLYMLPRVAYIDDTTWFRQPTIGHDIWLSKVSKYIDVDTYDSAVAVYAFALSQDYNDLPSAYNQELVKKSIEDFLVKMSKYNKEQIEAAVLYCQTGIKQSTDVYPELTKRQKEENIDWLECVSVGVLHNARCVLFGMTAKEIMEMPKETVEDMIEKTLQYNHPELINNDGQSELAAYMRTLDSIKERLTTDNQKD